MRGADVVFVGHMVRGGRMGRWFVARVRAFACCYGLARMWSCIADGCYMSGYGMPGAAIYVCGARAWLCSRACCWRGCVLAVICGGERGGVRAIGVCVCVCVCGCMIVVAMGCARVGGWVCGWWYVVVAVCVWRCVCGGCS